MNRSIDVEADGVYVYKDLQHSRERRKVEPGWEKGWIFENVYGWTWIGPFRWDSYRHLVVLHYEPSFQ